MKPRVNQQVFGKDQKPTIYYLAGHDSIISLYRPHIYLLVLLGYRVVAFDYAADILNSGQPKFLLNALHDLQARINEDKTNRQVAGILGISLGSWIGLNLLTLCRINQGLFLAGGASIVHTIWDIKALSSVKEKFIQNGYDEKALHREWGRFDYNLDGSRFSFARFALIGSDGDEVIDSENVKNNLSGWRETNNNIKFISYRRLRHTAVIIAGMFHVFTLRKYLNVK